MNFALWLAKRAWKSVREYWDKPGTDEQLSGKETVLADIILSCGLGGIILALAFAIRLKDARYLGLALLIMAVIYPIMYGLDTCKSLRNQYRTEQPEQEKPKRKRKNGSIADIKVVEWDDVPDDEIWIVSQDGSDAVKIKNIGGYFEEGEADER